MSVVDAMVDILRWRVKVMEVKAIFVGKPDMSILVDPRSVNDAVDAFIDMGAISVTTRG